jgi:CBS domain containing-hemolysin-like protein
MIRRRLWGAGAHADEGAGSASAAGEQEQSILASLERLRETTVREVMTPRVDVVALRAPVSADDVARAVRESGHSRFPVYVGDLDSLEGVLFVKDLFRMNEEVTAASIDRRLREPFTVSEHRRVLDVLQEMRRRRHAFAVVIDEHGGVEGVLTVKDLVGELVGDLPDEFDRESDAELVRVDQARWLADGACPVDRLRDELGAPVPEGDYVTVGGFLFDRFGRIPAEGETLVHDDWEFRVTEMDRRRIAQVVVRAPSDSIGPGPGANGSTGK